MSLKHNIVLLIRDHFIKAISVIYINLTEIVTEASLIEISHKVIAEIHKFDRTGQCS